jgi:hydroxyacylglutathione hydrolase
MVNVQKFVFNPFYENTYVLYDSTLQCVIIDPGCCTDAERAILTEFIEDKGLTPVKLINTHCHIDHIPGNKFLAEKYNLGLEIHKNEVPVMHGAPEYGSFFGFHCEPSPEPVNFLDEGDIVTFGNTELKVIFTPGHSPGSISFYYEDEFVISGDVLFRLGVGRFDLPGASGAILFKSITEKLMALPDKVKVFSGHGPETTIGFEREKNPYVKSEAMFT